MAEPPLDHVVRSVPPWRRGTPLTECGRDPGTVSVIARDELATRVKKLGKTRTSMTMCITCMETSAQRNTWSADPAAVMERECSRWMKTEGISRELRALAALVEAHPEEFYGYIDGLDETVDIRAARRRRDRDRARGVDARYPRPL